MGHKLNDLQKYDEIEEDTALNKDKLYSYES